MSKFTAEALATLNKVELRELCRSNGIGYNGLNNDGMRAALLTVPGEVRTLTETEEREASVEVTSDTVVAPELQNAPEPTDTAVVVVEPVREPRVLPTLVVPPAPPAAPEKVRKIQANRPEANGVKRPSEGTICAQIWAWCDEVHNAGDKVTAKELRSALPALDDTTKTVQYYRWRKFNGIQGRS
jgi:hypothetical protein